MSNYLVDGADLTSVAAAIRTKGGTSAQLQFPQGFVDAVGNIQAGGDPLEMARRIANGTITSYVDDELTSLRRYAFYGCNLVEFICHNVNSLMQNCFTGNRPLKIALTKWTYSSGYAMQTNTAVIAFDLEAAYQLPANNFNGCTQLSTLILRHNGVVSLQNTNAFTNTPFASGKAGGTLYVPQALIASYQSATNWSTILNYGSGEQNQILPIEGSIYETQYVDGTPIPTA